MNIISRAEWGALPPKRASVQVNPGRRRYFVVHHSGAGVNQTVAAIQHWCMFGRGFNDIDYNFLVRGDTGEIYEGRGWDKVGSHTVGYNTSGIGVCIIGNDQASDAAKRSVRWLYEEANKRCGHGLWLRGHRELATTGTDCPGANIEAWVKAGLPAPGWEPKPTESTEVDIVTPADIEKVAARAAELVWSQAYGSKFTEARWPGHGTKPMRDFVALAAMGAKDATKAALAAKGGGIAPSDAKEIAAAVAAELSGPDLAAALREVLTDEERLALSKALA